MRKLNPRAWSIDGQCWCSRVDYDGYKEEWSGIVPVLDPENRSKRIGEVEDTNIIVELPTGLKDKNGKKIYEGDILQKYEGGALCAVYWDDEELQWYVEEKLLDCPEGGLLFNLKYLGDEKVVVGNIHENPELLENE